ncbi:hypothetical protein GCM10023160_02590 [Brachybacterium paraconglomeratum]|uniref:hypothetical protein n=1 Tax=Brachybacterium paraconglomeratum TaxID=173362 RepID=UPI0031E5C344
MRNATIATSRTRVTAEDHLIDYRPLPAAWGDVASLQQVRAAKARAAARGQDPSTLVVTAPPAQSAPLPAATPLATLPATTHRSHRGLLSSLLREPGVHRRPRHGRGQLAAA